MARAERTNWERETVSDRMLDWKDACKNCYPGDEHPEVGDDAVVLQNGSRQSMIHRPKETPTHAP
jgi:hypothetical protein